MSSSPGWKKPSDLMKKKILKKRPSFNNRQSNFENGSGKPKPSPRQSPRSRTVAGKRRNPFGCSNTSPKKRLEIDESVNVVRNMEDKHYMFDALDHIGDSKQSMQCSVAAKEFTSNVIENKATCDILEHLPAQSDAEHISYEAYPVDWCLKTKVRFVSSSTFNWCTPLKSLEESSGLRSFVTQKEFHVPSDENVSGKKSTLQSCCMCWIHPNLPWLKLFPRIASDKAIGKMTTINHDEEIQTALLSDWIDSFTSVFHLLRSGMCEYFYVCCHQFSVLFRGGNVSSIGACRALITPTSRGFREALKSEGVDFTMPLNSLESPDDGSIMKEEDRRETKSSDENYEESAILENSNKDHEDEIVETDEGASSWLADLGLDKSKFRSLDPDKVKLQRDVYRSIDNRPESMVLIEGTDTVALFNFLLNCRTCIANTGPQAGIPPTIIAPVAFKGATLKAHKVKQGTVRQQLEDGSVVQSYSLEVTGPLLPSNITQLQSLVKASNQSFAASYSVHEPTTPFSAIPGIQNPKDIENSWSAAGESSGSFTGAIKGVCLSKEINNGRQAIRELTCNEGRFVWMT